MTETCIVPNCKSGREFSEKPVAYFNIPTNVELRNKWIEAIPNTTVPLKATDMVCEKHFYESDVIRHYIVQDAAGNVVDKVAYDYPRLAETAVPSIFPGFQLGSNQPIVQNGLQTAPPPGQTRTSTDLLYDYMLMDAVSDVAGHTIAGVGDVIAKVAHHTQPPKINEPEVVSTNASESHPLLGTDASQNLPSPANDISGDSVNHTANTLDVFRSDDVPITSEPVPIFVQPVSTFAMSEKVDSTGLTGDVPITSEPVPIFVQPVSTFAMSERVDSTGGTGGGDVDGDDGCCGGDDGCCGGDDGCCGGDDGCCGGDDGCCGGDNDGCCDDGGCDCGDCDCGDCDCGDCDCGDCVLM